MPFGASEGTFRLAAVRREKWQETNTPARILVQARARTNPASQLERSPVRMTSSVVVWLQLPSGGNARGSTLPSAWLTQVMLTLDTNLTEGALAG